MNKQPSCQSMNIYFSKSCSRMSHIIPEYANMLTVVENINLNMIQQDIEIIDRAVCKFFNLGLADEDEAMELFALLEYLNAQNQKQT